MGEEPLEVLSEREEKFEAARKKAGFFIGPALFFLALLVPMPSLTPAAHRLAAVLAFVITFWITEAIPIPATALLGPLLCVILGIAPAKETFAAFSDPLIFLFIGSFILAEAMMKHELDVQFAYYILSLPFAGKSLYRLLFFFGAITAFLSMWISNTAACAMMYPIGLGILSAISKSQADGKKFYKDAGIPFMLMAAYAASVGGIGTPVGTPPNIIGIGMIEKFAGVKISFFQWMLLAVPLLVVMYAFLVTLLIRRSGLKNIPLDASAFPSLKQKKFTAAQRNVFLCFMLAVALWIFPGLLGIVYGAKSEVFTFFNSRLPEGMVALLAALLLFFLPVNLRERKFTLLWRDAQKIDWGTILLFGGGLSLGTLMFQTKLAEAIGNGLLHLTHANSLSAITALAAFTAILVSEATSNTASANMVIPVMIAIAKSAGVNPLPPALAACLGASFGFMLPVSTPPNAIVYGSGLVPITKMMRAGIVFDITGFVIITVGVLLLSAFLF